jgi:hypothetical protein
MSLAPEDVVNSIKKEAERDAAYEAAVRKVAEQTEKDKVLLQKHVYDNANPDPMLVAAIGMVVLLILWFMYMMLLKPSLTGVWYDKVGNRIYLKHNKLDDVVSVHVNMVYAGHAKNVDNLFQYGSLIGIFDYNNRIIFMDGSQWDRLL